MNYQVISVGKADAKLVLYLHELAEELISTPRKTVVICPGGGYRYTSKREGEPIAMEFYHMNYNAAILWYSCAPATYPTALEELGEAFEYLRAHADELGVDAEKLAVMGFSAGGHLAASYACFWKKFGFAKPAGAILCYPVITSGEFAHRDSFVALLGDQYDALVDEMSLENRVNEDHPKTFLWTTFEDGSVPAENAFFYMQALRKLHIPVEFHMFEHGGHGLALADARTMHPDYPKNLVPSVTPWIQLCMNWFEGM